MTELLPKRAKAEDLSIQILETIKEKTDANLETAWLCYVAALGETRAITVNEHQKLVRLLPLSRSREFHEILQGIEYFDEHGKQLPVEELERRGL
jgi:hypothetical protein